MELKTMKAGQMVPCTIEEFTQGLRRLSGWADERFGIMSDPSALIGERLSAAADLIDELAANKRTGNAK